MNTSTYFNTGRRLFAVALLAIGLIHIIFHNFPKGLLPVDAGTPGRTILIYVSGIALAISGILLLMKKFAPGAYLAAAIWTIFLLLLHLPLLIMHPHDPTAWTPAFENILIISGACMLIGSGNIRQAAWQIIGKYLLLSALLVLAVQHYMYLTFISNLVPAWLPGHIFWAWVVLIAFVAASLSILTGVQVRLTGLLLALMFLIWVVILHIPRAISAGHSEPEWTSTCVALAAAGVSLLLAATAKK